MFILLKTGAMLNLHWLLDCFQGKREKNIVIFYLVNGTKIIEEYDTANEASARLDEIRGVMEEALQNFKLEIVDELPTENISPSTLYLVSADSEDDQYREYRYVDGEWEPIGTHKLDLKPLENDIVDINQQITWNEY